MKPSNKRCIGTSQITFSFFFHLFNNFNQGDYIDPRKKKKKRKKREKKKKTMTIIQQ